MVSDHCFDLFLINRGSTIVLASSHGTASCGRDTFMSYFTDLLIYSDNIVTISDGGNEAVNKTVVI